MSKREMISLLVKAFGLFMLIIVAVGVPVSLVGLLSTWREGQGLNMPSPWPFVAGGIGLGMIAVGLCWQLITRSDAVARRLYPEDAPLPDDGGLGPDEWRRMAFGVVGVLAITSALPRLVQTLYAAIAIRILGGGASNLGPMLHSRYYAPVVGAVVQLLVGIALVLGTQQMARLWRRFLQQRQFEG